MSLKPQRVEALSLAQQNYVEALAELCREVGYARTTDLAEKLHVRMPSVSQVVGRLVAQGIAERRSRSEIVLTARGRRLASQLEWRHRALRRFMVRIMGMDPVEADTMACRVEHSIDGRFADRLSRLAEYLESSFPGSIDAMAAHVRNGYEQDEK
jgi:DtxR family Mn-dependent transcriptional regulator